MKSRKQNKEDFYSRGGMNGNRNMMDEEARKRNGDRGGQKKKRYEK